jgi:hypothetical protein
MRSEKLKTKVKNQGERDSDTKKPISVMGTLAPGSKGESGDSARTENGHDPYQGTEQWQTIEYDRDALGQHNRPEWNHGVVVEDHGQGGNPPDDATGQQNVLDRQLARQSSYDPTCGEEKQAPFRPSGVSGDQGGHEMPADDEQDCDKEKHDP